MITMEQGLCSKVLNLDLLVDNTEDQKVARLRKVEFKYTVDDKPFLRLHFGDIKGRVCIGRMFDIPNLDKVGPAIEALTGSLVLCSFRTGAEPLQTGITVLSISAVEANALEQIEQQLKESYTLNFSKSWTNFKDLLMKMQVITSDSQASGWTIFQMFSHESIANGTPGGICDVLSNTITAARCAGIRTKPLQIFLDVVAAWCANQNVASSMLNLSILAFSQDAIKKLSADDREELMIGTDFVTMFMGNSEVSTPETRLIFNLYSNFKEYSDLTVRCARLPSGGFISANGIVRK